MEIGAESDAVRSTGLEDTGNDEARDGGTRGLGRLDKIGNEEEENPEGISFGDCPSRAGRAQNSGSQMLILREFLLLAMLIDVRPLSEFMVKPTDPIVVPFPTRLLHSVSLLPLKASS